MPALDYYQEEAVVKLIEGDWKWQDRFSLGKQLEKRVGHSVISPAKAKDFLPPGEDVPQID